MNGKPLRTCPRCRRRICTRNRSGKGPLYPHRCRPTTCERRGCKRTATVFKTHFELTGEYTADNLMHGFCQPCDDGIEFDREIRRQMHEFASEDEQISGDYES